MERLKKILVCIDRPDRDYRMLSYLGALCRVTETKEIHLLHVVSEGTSAAVDGIMETEAAAGFTPDTLRALAAEHFKGRGDEEVICQVLTGSPLVEILRYALDQSIDLIVVGRQASGALRTELEALLAGRITAKATCSVLVVPVDAPGKADKIIVPVRDSACSANALDVACAVASVTGGTVCCLNVFYVGSGYSSVGSTLEEHMAQCRKAAKRECRNLLARVDTRGVKVVTRCAPDLHVRPVPVILEEVENESADLVVIGARGRTGAAGVLLGVVTEHLIHQSAVPVLAVKKKGECIGVLRALLSLTG